MPLQNHATSLRGMIHSSGMAHRCTPSSRFLQARTDATIVASRYHGSHQRAVRSASSRQRLDLGSIFGAKHSQVALPQWSVTAPLAIDPRARAGSSKAGHPIKTRGDWEPGQQRQPSRGRGTRGPRSIGLFLLMRGCAGWGGVGGLMLLLVVGLLGIGAGVQADVAWARNGV